MRPLSRDSNLVAGGGILGGNLDRSLKSFPPCYSQTPLLTDCTPHLLFLGLEIRGRPSRNAANTFPNFSAGLSQNSVIVKKIKQLVEKHEKLTICKGNSAPFRLFLLKIVLKFNCRFLL